ncbi:WLM domain-containing protein [Dipodascopsis uninucleata]
MADSYIGKNATDIHLQVAHKGVQHIISLKANATVANLQDLLAESTNVPVEHQKLMLPKRGTAKPEHANMLLSEIFSNTSSERPAKVMLIGSTPDEAEKMRSAVHTVPMVERRVVSSLAKNAAKKKSTVDKESQLYTFHKLIPLPFLPYAEKSLEYLERLKNDRGVQAVMRKYKWSVPVLTELDPASNTTHDSKCLGLNRNMGEVIELRLRTDSYDGWRDYKTVRKTLCHELAHNVYSPGHDAPFWKLTRTLEREVIELDPFGGNAHKLSTEEYYIPPGYYDLDENDNYQDSGGWQGGEFALGSGESSSTSNNLMSSNDVRKLSPRELMLKAAEQRIVKKNQKNEYS